MNSITKRWIKGSLLIIIVLLVLAEIFLTMSFRNSYYSEVETALTNRINTINGTLSASGNMSQSDKEKLLFNLTYDFAETDKFELMLLDENGQLLATSSGFAPSSTQHISDFQLTDAGEDNIFINSYISAMDEKIVSATFKMEEAAGEICAVRIVTSVTRVDEEIYILIALGIIAAVIIVAVSVVSGMYFIRSIVMPINSIKDTADKIAQGEFNVRVEHNKKYDRELSELCDSINHMAQELGRSEELKNEFISSVSH
ncbi:MAG: HAMP domain-containing protein, partial [Oscillospiraceae bacterium]|nr:HAMP domain-containing protein [Oscillospiraceae bacterium]